VVEDKTRNRKLITHRFVSSFEPPFDLLAFEAFAEPEVPPPVFDWLSFFFPVAVFF
jgi:hypothetical protein